MGFLGKKKSSESKFINKTMGNSDVITLIGEGFLIEGNITSPSSTRLDGTVKGNINGKASLIIGEKGIVSGEVTAMEVVVHGKVEGNVHSDKLVIKSGGVINGDVSSKSLIIEDGGVYNGKCIMESDTINGESKYPGNAKSDNNLISA